MTAEAYIQELACHNWCLWDIAYQIGKQPTSLHRRLLRLCKQTWEAIKNHTGVDYGTVERDAQLGDTGADYTLGASVMGWFVPGEFHGAAAASVRKRYSSGDGHSGGEDERRRYYGEDASFEKLTWGRIRKRVNYKKVHGRDDGYFDCFRQGYCGDGS